GASTLAAVAARPERIEAVAAVINGFAGVNHNYERENAYNLWFVVTGRDWADVTATLAGIEQQTGLAVLNLPLEKSYHIDLGFSLYGNRATKPVQKPLIGKADAEDRRLLGAIEQGLMLVPRPFAAVAERLHTSESAVIDRLAAMIERGIITRFGIIVRHRAFGYSANAMAVWDVAEAAVDQVADGFAAAPGVTLCYRRPRRLPHWRFNLFTMIHGRDRASAMAVVDGLAQQAAPHLAGHSVLFSLRCFKQRGAVFSRSREAAE
ncbi:MAG TPA: AsnC family transcriptional regulator, partial [Beijerinckiaceae bacterium]|nr:AsnC family transcriptional regulator [Beijerinckiaceae bacterium]